MVRESEPRAERGLGYAIERATAICYDSPMGELRRQAEIRVRLSQENLDFLERCAAARHLTAAKVIDLSLNRLREEESGSPAVSEAPLETVTNETRAKFDRLAAEWRSAVRYVSSLSQMVTHPAYQRIIGMGAVAIPLMLERLRREPEHWFWALKSIAGEDPVPEECRGDLEAMSRSWLSWGRQHGYC